MANYFIAAITDDQYVGCYQFDAGTVMVRGPARGDGSVDKCIGACQTEGYSYAGLRVGL